MSTLITGAGRSIAPHYNDNISLTITLNDLASAATATSAAVNNSANRDGLIEFQVSVNGTAAATAWLDVRLLKSIDKGVTYGTWESSQVLPGINLSATPQVYHSGRVEAPEYFKLSIKNNTGAALGSSSNTASYQPIDTKLA